MPAFSSLVSIMRGTLCYIVFVFLHDNNGSHGYALLDKDCEDNCTARLNTVFYKTRIYASQFFTTFLDSKKECLCYYVKVVRFTKHDFKSNLEL